MAKNQLAIISSPAPKIVSFTLHKKLGGVGGGGGWLEVTILKNRFGQKKIAVKCDIFFQENHSKV